MKAMKLQWLKGRGGRGSQAARRAAVKAMEAKKHRKAMKSISEAGLLEALATATELKKSDCAKVLTSLSEIMINEVNETGKFTIPGIVKIKTHVKPAMKDMYEYKVLKVRLPKQVKKAIVYSEALREGVQGL